MSMSVLLDNTTVTAMLSVSILLDLLPVNVMMGLLVMEQVVKVRIIIQSKPYLLKIKLAASIKCLKYICPVIDPNILQCKQASGYSKSKSVCKKTKKMVKVSI